MHKGIVVDLYERHTVEYDRARGRSLQERSWLDRFLAHVEHGKTVLDLGCGMGEPIARYLTDRGFWVFGIDASPSMVELCRGPTVVDTQSDSQRTPAESTPKRNSLPDDFLWRVG
jgi:cyclopropane fatty-acyl-phospholipid synthase-like methyltransferase